MDVDLALPPDACAGAHEEGREPPASLPWLLTSMGSCDRAALAEFLFIPQLPPVSVALQRALG